MEIVDFSFLLKLNFLCHFILKKQHFLLLLIVKVQSQLKVLIGLK